MAGEDEKPGTAETVAPKYAKPAAAAPSPEKPEEATPDHGPAIDRAVRRWLDGHIRNSDVSRNTGAFNAVMASLGALRTYLSEEL